MSYSADFTDQSFLIKPRYKDDVLIYNWFEERALRDPKFLPLLTKSLKTEDVEGAQKLSAAAKEKADREKNALKESSNTTNYQKNKKQTKEHEKYDADGDLIDPLRGYYVSTYTRSYGHPIGYSNLDTFPTADFHTRRLTAMNPDGTSAQKTSACYEQENNNLECEQLEESRMENSGCLRCKQLAEN